MRITKSTPINERNKIIDASIKDRNIIRLTDYINQKTKVKWECKTCNHVWESTAGGVVYANQGCPSCWLARMPIALTSDPKQEAIASNKKTYTTNKPCKYGHLSPRYIANNGCVECGSMRHKQWVKDNPEKQKELNNRHKHKRRLNNIKRKNQQPNWANEDLIKEIYNEATLLTKETNIVHHVHHIVPLLSDKTVCGLHCEDNLMVVSKEMHQNIHHNKNNLRKLW